MDYAHFLESKKFTDTPTGIAALVDVNPMLFPFQRDIVQWALRRGRAAIFADCGMGKTGMQLEWAKHVAAYTQKPVLILAPLAVSKQTVREGDKFHVPVNLCRTQADVCPGVNITNYEKIDHFDPAAFGGVVLDESSIIKSFNGKIRNQVITQFVNVPFRLACTATPAPNDFMELGNHAEFVGSMTRTEMLAMFFVHDMSDTSKWRLKGHAESEYWKWVCSWAVNIRKPSDLGYDDAGFVLPELKMVQHTVNSSRPMDGHLFPMEAQTLIERRAARKATIDDRVHAAAELANSNGEQWIVWCDLNHEGDALENAIEGSVQVAGADTDEHKEQAVMDFISGKIRVLVAKPSMFGFGLNLQCCHNQVFVGLSDSYEKFYQAVRRCWRFGQTQTVNCHVITADMEGAVLRNIQRKEKDSIAMGNEMVKNMADITRLEIKGINKDTMGYREFATDGERFTAYLGDCVEGVKQLPSDSVHYTIFSPPFASLYTYSNSDRDMGNCADADEFAAHFKFLVSELHRVTMPGRLLSFHCMNLPTSKERDGFIGVSDFRGNLIRMFQDAGFIFHSEVCIWKDPVIAMQRTKALGLLHKQIRKDSCMSRQGIPDYLVTMRKHGDNPERVSHDHDDFPVSLWQKYASPVWMDINPSNTLQKESAREENDEKHICPLQLEVIERALKLWSNPNDLVLSPFMGIGSEGYTALKMGRRFVGFELKPSYYAQAVINLKNAEDTGEQQSLFAIR